MMKQNYFISAGEFSGDLLAADLVGEIKKTCPNLFPYGITGPALRQAGVSSLLNNEQLSFMGISDVLQRLSQLRLIEQRVLQQIDLLKPRFAILVDYPGFHFGLAEHLKLRGIPVIQYVAPKVWAWGGKRVARLKRDFDLVLGMLPFEDEFFKQQAVDYLYVGSPIVDRIDAFLETFALPSDTSSKIVGCFPGSRESEVKSMLPVFFDLDKQLKIKSKKEFQVMISVASNLGWAKFCEIFPELRTAKRSTFSSFREVYEWRGLFYVVGQNFELMRRADLACVTSGTATLECALIGTPQIVVYKTSGLTYALAKAFVKVKHISLPNLILNREIVKEFVQDFSMSQLVDEASRILHNHEYRKSMLSYYDMMRAKLRGGAAATAAQVIAQKYKVRE